LFAVDRMLAIFYSIIEEPVENTIDIPIQVNRRFRAIDELLW
jgi:hypothetical protein